MTTAAMPDLASILEAGRRIEGQVARSRLRRSDTLSAVTGAEVFLKLEVEQPTGSFKVRGACNALTAMLERSDIPGFTTASTGNHARAVAYMGRRLERSVKAYVSGTVSESRVHALRGLGADVDRSTSDQTAAIRAAQEFASANGYGFIPPFDHPDVISGQGTIGVELIEDMPRLDAVIVPVSGGGLVSGVGLAVKGLSPKTSVIGVCAERAAAMHDSLRAGHPVAVPEIQTVAESLMGDLGPDNRYTFRIAQKVIDEIETVSDEEIISAMTWLRDQDGIGVEAAAAASAAYMRRGDSRWRGARVALLVTGNAGVELHIREARTTTH